MPQTRQLAAIMFTDIVGYTAMMGKDEQRAFELLRKNRELQKPIVEKYNGRWIKELGDGVMASFTTVSDAVYSAQEIQQQCNQLNDFSLRIGIHHGEIVFEGDDVFGDAVNVASRIQAVAPVGGIWISESVHHNVVNKNDINTRYVKTEKLKNVVEPVRIYEVTLNADLSRKKHDNKRYRINEKIHKTPVRALLLSVAAIAVLILGLVFLLNRGKGFFAKTRIESIAVMPFVNESRIADMEYLSDGMTETLINSLSKLKEISVKARSSVFHYKGKEIDPKKIGAELAVQAILNGRISQRGDNIFLNLELVDVSTGNQIWGENYNRKTADLVALQSDIARDVSKKLHQHLTGSGQNVEEKYTSDSEAYQLYLRGLFHWNKRGDDIKKAIDYFNQAKEKDPSFALAYAGLAVAYSVLPNNTFMSKQEAVETHLKTKAAAIKAIELDNTLAEPYAALAASKVDAWDFAGAEKDYKRAIEINSNFATAHQWYSELLAILGRNDEALAEVKKAYELDPFSPAVNMSLGRRYLEAKRYDEAVDQLNKTIEIAPDYPSAFYFLGMLYFEINRFEESFALLSKADILRKQETPESAAQKTNELRQALKTGGKKGYWRKVLQYDLNAYNKGVGLAVFVARTYAELGENNKAFEWLEKAYNERDWLLIYLKGHIWFENIRSDPRFKDLLRRVGLPVN